MTKESTKPDVIGAFKEIQTFNFNEEDTLPSLMETFYNVCRKFGIKQGKAIIKDGKQCGREVNTAEWAMVRTAFEDKVVEYFQFQDLLVEPPKDLMQELNPLHTEAVGPSHLWGQETACF